MVCIWFRYILPKCPSGNLRYTQVTETFRRLKMDAIIKCIENLRIKLDRHWKDDLKEYPTRIIFVDPLLQALGWDVRDPDEVALEYPTIDGKSVDYALKINHKPVLFIEAKPLNDPLADVKSITQVVGYAANAGVEWCILTNGVTYKVYRSAEKAEAPDKLLFEISLDPEKTEGMTIQQVAEQFALFSKDAMARGSPKEVSEQISTAGKPKKALGKIFMDLPNTLIRLVHLTVGHVKKAFKRLWVQISEIGIFSTPDTGSTSSDRATATDKDCIDEHRIKEKPQYIYNVSNIGRLMVIDENEERRLMVVDKKTFGVEKKLEEKKKEEEKIFEEEAEIKEEERRLEEERKQLEEEKQQRTTEEGQRLEKVGQKILEDEVKKVAGGEYRWEDQEKHKKEEEENRCEEVEREKSEKEEGKTRIEEEDIKLAKEEDTEKSSEIKEKVKTQKPYIKKIPIEERKNEDTEIYRDKKKESAITKPTTEIDLGRRKGPRLIKQPQIEVSPEKNAKVPEEKETPIKVESPYIEIDLDEAKVFFVIPKQQLEASTIKNIPQELHYKLELNGNEQTISARVSNNQQGVAAVEERIIDLEQPLKSFKIVYPDELQGKIYIYQHSSGILYPFIAIGNNRGRMYYLYDKRGGLNPLPNRDVWVLLEEDFYLTTDPDVIEERWIWGKYQPMRISLKDINELIIKDGQTGKGKRIPCESSFSIECDTLIKDDFDKQMPLFVGDNLKIKAPTVNPSGWMIWIQNKQAGYKVVAEDWTGDDPLELKLPDDLPCECGEFQIDICEQEDRIPVETLFFRYIPFIQLEFPRDLVIPDPEIGHKKEFVKILLEKDFQDWVLKTDEKTRYKYVENGYQIELLPEQDTLRFSLMKQNKPETETNFKITIPRLRWRTSKNETWYDKPLQIKRDELIVGVDFYLILCTNDFDTRYDLLAILETDDQRLQEAKCIRKSTVYSLPLNQFYDTINENKRAMTLKIEILSLKENQLLHEIKILSVTPPILRCKLCDFESYDGRDMVSHIKQFHLQNFVKPLTLKEMREYDSSLPVEIYKCSYCDLYVSGDDPSNPTSLICSHIEEYCSKADRSKGVARIAFQVITNTDEIRKNVIPDLPHFRKCKLCGKHFKNPNEEEYLKHMLEVHEEEFYLYE